MNLPPTVTIERMTRAQGTKFLRMRALAEEEAQLNARVRALNDERKKLSAEVEDSFGNREQMRLSARQIIIKNKIDVPAAVIQRAAYSYVQWKEISG